MKRRQLSKKTVATLAMMGLAAGIISPATASAAPQQQQQQQHASAGCAGCGSHKRSLGDNESNGRTRRYNPAGQTADGSCSGAKAPKNGNHSCNGSTGATGQKLANGATGATGATGAKEIADGHCSSPQGCNGQNNKNGNGNGQQSSYRQQRQNAYQQSALNNQNTNKTSTNR